MAPKAQCYLGGASLPCTVWQCKKHCSKLPDKVGFLYFLVLAHARSPAVGHTPCQNYRFRQSLRRVRSVAVSTNFVQAKGPPAPSRMFPGTPREDPGLGEQCRVRVPGKFTLASRARSKTVLHRRTQAPAHLNHDGALACIGSTACNAARCNLNPKP